MYVCIFVSYPCQGSIATTAFLYASKDPATRNDFVNDIVNEAGGFHRRRWNSTIVTISSKLDMLTFDRRLERFRLRSGYLRSFSRI